MLQENNGWKATGSGVKDSDSEQILVIPSSNLKSSVFLPFEMLLNKWGLQVYKKGKEKHDGRFTRYNSAIMTFFFPLSMLISQEKERISHRMVIYI